VDRGIFETKAKQVFVERYIILRSRVGDLIFDHPEIEAVGVESPTYGEQQSEGLYALFVYVNEVMFVRRKDVVYFDPGSMKMLAKIDPTIRKGKMHKSDMVAAARADTGITGKFNHNEADAYHVARFAARFFLFARGELTDEQLTPSEYRAFARTHTFTRGERAGETVKIGAVFKEGKRFYRFSQLDPYEPC
jgi:hypothetical protein